MEQHDVRIHFCFRFHVNFYHSYRGDTADEDGFGKDIRIIRGILNDLDRLQVEGIQVSCAWDFDNVFSLGKMIPQYAPDIIERIKNRIANGHDEIHLMSWNNGMLGLHTAEEFKLAIEWAQTSPDHCGNSDTLGSFVPIVRPQECMVTPSHIQQYRDLGIEAISLYYSSIPFNAFGSFIPPLPVDQQYNPLLLQDPQTGASIRLLPAINQGDLAEYGLSARRMLAHIRRKQMCMENPTDLMVLLDMDADDTFWAGIVPKPMAALIPSFAGLYHLVKSIAPLPYLSFTKAWSYLETHPDAGSISIGQDMADGAFDGYASWAEKLDNHQLWAKVTECREYWQKVKDLVSHSHQASATEMDSFAAWSAHLPEGLQTIAEKAITLRLRLLSTTHFGLSAPVMNVHRLEAAYSIANEAITLSKYLFNELSEHVPSDSSSKASQPSPIHMQNPNPLGLELLADGSTRIFSNRQSDKPHSVLIKAPWLGYGKKIHRTKINCSHFQNGNLCTSGAISLEKKTEGFVVQSMWERSLYQDPHTDFLIADCTISYPKTPHKGFNKTKAQRLQRTWDPNWKQTAPFEIVAFNAIPKETKIYVWKEDFTGRLSSYILDYISYGDNTMLASINNHVTPSFLALSDGTHGILIAQSTKQLHGFAFCPLRQIIEGKTQSILMNPFGTYWGKQYHYPTAVSNIGRFAALLTAEHLHPSAPSWEGNTVDFTLMLALYNGNDPPEVLLQEARRFSKEGTSE
jgi:hypothetical protein